MAAVAEAAVAEETSEQGVAARQADSITIVTISTGPGDEEEEEARDATTSKSTTSTIKPL